MKFDYEKLQLDKRKKFFDALSIDDDGRLNPVMTRDEFVAFCKVKKTENEKYGYPSGKTCVEVYFEFAPYHDISYSYCFDDDTVYESRYYIGE